MAAKNLIAAGAAGLAVATLAEGQQPHMQAALKALNNAAAALQAAADDKGGHRAKAIQLVSQAIDQVQQGIQAGAKKK
jgi:predicted ATPase